jgi:Hg(II)-responsive transcriptional regulator
MRTSQLAERTGVNTETLRYYERRGLLAEPRRTNGGYRDYTSQAVRVVRFIKQAQSLGFTLSDTEELLHLAEGGPESCDEVQRMAAEKISALGEKIRLLEEMRTSLERLQETCTKSPADRECPLLAALAPDEAEGP